MESLLTERKNCYLCQLDYVKLVASILVVALHTHPLYPMGEKHFLFRLLRMIGDIAVPFFFLSSSYMLYSACRGVDEKGQIRIISKYILRIARQYCVWSLIYLPISVYGYLSEGASPLGMAFSLFRNLLLVGQNFCSWQLWYLCSMLWGGLLLLLLHKYLKNDAVTAILAVLVFALSCAVDDIQKVQTTQGSVLALLQKVIGVTINGGRIMLGFVYLSIGKILASKSRYLSLRIAIPLTVVLFIAAVLTGNAWLGLMMHVAFFTMVLVMPTGENKERARFARKLSTCIYFTHMLVVFAVYCFCGFTFCYGLGMFVAATMISAAISVMLCLYGNKQPKIFHLLFG